MGNEGKNQEKLGLYAVVKGGKITLNLRGVLVIERLILAGSWPKVAPKFLLRYSSNPGVILVLKKESWGIWLDSDCSG